MLIVDLLHEFELGVWKSLFIHLLRILEAHDKTLLVELDRRYVIICWQSNGHEVNVLLEDLDWCQLLVETLSDDFRRIFQN